MFQFNPHHFRLSHQFLDISIATSFARWLSMLWNGSMNKQCWNRIPLQQSSTVSSLILEMIFFKMVLFEKIIIQLNHQTSHV